MSNSELEIEEISDHLSDPRAFIDYISTMSLECAINLRKALIFDLDRIQNQQPVDSYVTWSVELRKLHDYFFFWAIRFGAFDNLDDLQNHGLRKGVVMLWDHLLNASQPGCEPPTKRCIQAVDNGIGWALLELKAASVEIVAAVLEDYTEGLGCAAISPVLLHQVEGVGSAAVISDDAVSGGSSGDESDSSSSSFDFGSPGSAYNPEVDYGSAGSSNATYWIRIGRAWLEKMERGSTDYMKPHINGNTEDSPELASLRSLCQVDSGLGPDLMKRIRKTLASEGGGDEQSHRGFVTVDKGEKLVTTLVAILGCWGRMLELSLSSRSNSMEVRSTGKARLVECRYCLRLITAEEMKERDAECASHCENDVVWPYPCLFYSCNLDFDCALGYFNSAQSVRVSPKVRMFATKEELEEHMLSEHFSTERDEIWLFRELAARYGLKQYPTTFEAGDGLVQRSDGPCILCGQDVGTMLQNDGEDVTVEDVWRGSVEHLIGHLKALPGALFLDPLAADRLLEVGAGAVFYKKKALREL